jgi:hypothetical protein
VRLDRPSQAQAFTGSTGGTICVAKVRGGNASWRGFNRGEDGANALGGSGGRSPEAHRNPGVLDGMVRTDGRFWLAVDRIPEHH